MAKKRKKVAGTVSKKAPKKAPARRATTQSAVAKSAKTEKKTSKRRKTSGRPKAVAANGHSPIQLNAESVLAMRFISYSTPLELARRWLRSGEASERQQACKLLEGLFRRFDHSLEIGHQLALAYLEENREVESKQILDRLSLICRNPNEQVLARCGRLSRDQGDSYVNYPEIGGSSDTERDALPFYQRALGEYQAAYEIRSGHYPGINLATLHLLIAMCQRSNKSVRDKHVSDCETLANELLKCRTSWPLEMKDDAIWHSATEGEIHLLLRQWNKAATCYRAAQKHELFQPFHRDSMRKQAIRIRFCHKRLGVKNLGPFTKLENVFPAK